MKKSLLGIIGVLAFSSVAFGGSSSKVMKEVIEPVIPEPCIDGGEFIVGIFGGGAIVEETLQGYDDSFGGGVELLYAINPYVVVGAEYYAFSSEPAHSYSGVLQLRYPINCLAPYVFGTVGGIADGQNSFAVGGGGGLEYRIKKGFGIFTDGRYVYADDGDETHVFVRGGFRFVF